MQESENVQASCVETAMASKSHSNIRNEFEFERLRLAETEIAGSFWMRFRR